MLVRKQSRRESRRRQQQVLAILDNFLPADIVKMIAHYTLDFSPLVCVNCINRCKLRLLKSALTESYAQRLALFSRFMLETHRRGQEEEPKLTLPLTSTNISPSCVHHLCQLCCRQRGEHCGARKHLYIKLCQRTGCGQVAGRKKFYCSDCF